MCDNYEAFTKSDIWSLSQALHIFLCMGNSFLFLISSFVVVVVETDSFLQHLWCWYAPASYQLLVIICCLSSSWLDFHVNWFLAPSRSGGLLLSPLRRCAVGTSRVTLPSECFLPWPHPSNSAGTLLSYRNRTLGWGDGSGSLWSPRLCSPVRDPPPRTPHPRYSFHPEWGLGWRKELNSSATLNCNFTSTTGSWMGVGRKVLSSSTGSWGEHETCVLGIIGLEWCFCNTRLEGGEREQFTDQMPQTLFLPRFSIYSWTNVSSAIGPLL